MTDYSEKRLFERVDLPARLSYEVKNRPRLVKETTCKNISGNGICLAMNEKLIPQTQLSMNINVQDHLSRGLLRFPAWK